MASATPTHDPSRPVRRNARVGAWLAAAGAFLRGRAAAGLFWGGLILLHTPLLLRVLPQVGESWDAALRAVLLLVSQIVFALKLFDVAWLRLPSGRPLMGLIAAAVLLHAGVFVRHQTTLAIDLYLESAVVAGAALIVALRPARRVLRSAARPAPGRAIGCTRTAAYELSWRFRLRDWFAAVRALRAPPLPA